MTKWFKQIIDDQVDPETFHQVFPWADAMIGCPHDSVYHAEGDPWIHTKMVVAELQVMPDYLNLDPERQAVLRLAAWFHDVAKPTTTEEYWCEKEERDRVSQPGHAALGAAMAYQALIDAGAPVEIAREVHALVFWHQRPFFLLNENSDQRRAIQYSHEAGRGNWHELLTLCRADNLGRISINAPETLEAFDFLELWLEDLGQNIHCNLPKGAWPFGTDEARMKYLRGPNDGSAFFMPDNPTKGRMILLSGLPGAGKDTLIRECYQGVPVVSLDDIRGQMDVGWKDKQGQVLQAGWEAARVHMRSGEDFIWNATCLTRQVRQKIIGMARDYDYLIEGVSLDVPLQEAMRRNQARERAVPEAVMQKLGRKREPIARDEAHRLWSVDAEMTFTPVFGELQTEAPVLQP